MASELMIAVDKTARNYREEGTRERGFSLMAKRLGQDPTYFTNKCTSDYAGAHLKPDELIAIMDQADDYSILHTLARSCKKPHVVIELGEYPGVSDVELLDLHLHLQAEQGETADAIRNALSKGFISQEDFYDIDRELHEDVTCMYELRARLEGLVR